MIEHGLGLERLVETDPRLLALDPHDRADRGQLALAEQQMRALTGRSRLGPGPFGRQVAQLDRDRAARDFERCRHQQM